MNLYHKYFIKLCNNEIICSNISNLQLTLPQSRNCICDANCPQYKDCCSDSPFQPNDDAIPSTDEDIVFECVEGINDDVYMITTCPKKTTSSQNVIDKCHLTYISNIKAMDVLTLTPVITDEGIVYRNMFCAFCHDEFYFDFWQVLLGYHLPDTLLQHENIIMTGVGDHYGNTNFNTNIHKKVNLVFHQLMFTLESKWQKSINGYSFIFKYFDNSTIKLQVFSELQAQYQDKVRYCIPNMVRKCPRNSKRVVEELLFTITNENCADGPNSYVWDWNTNTIYKNEHCMKCNGVSFSTNTIKCWNNSLENFTTISKYYSTQQISIYSFHFHDVTSSHCEDIPEESVPYLAFCTEICYPIDKRSGHVCLVRDFFPVSDFDFYNDNKTIYSKNHDTYYTGPMEFTILDDEVYLCGSYITKSSSKVHKIWFPLKKWIINIILSVSVFFFTVQLLLFQNQIKSNSGIIGLADKNLAAYCLTLHITFLVLLAKSQFVSCRVPSTLMHYSFLSCLSWMLIMVYDLWRRFWKSSNRFRSSGLQETHTPLLKYISYCLIGWTLPLVFVLPGIHMDSSESMGCEYEFGDGLHRGSCFIRNRYWYLRLYTIPGSCILVLIAVLLGAIACCIRYNENISKSSHQQISLKAYIRLTFTLSMTWIFASCVTHVPLPHLEFLYDCLYAFQGVFILLFFTCQKSLSLPLYNENTNFRVVSSVLSVFSAYFINSEHQLDQVTKSTPINSDISANRNLDIFSNITTIGQSYMELRKGNGNSGNLNTTRKLR